MDQLLLILRKPASRPPAARPLARVLCELPLMVRDAVAAALGPGRALRGRGPAWLAEAADVRLESLEPSEPTHHAVGLSAVPLGRVAQQHYAQKSLFPELLPDPLDTGLDVLGDCLRSLNQNDGEGWPVPDSLCVRLLRLTKVLGPTSELAGFALSTRRRTSHTLALVTDQTFDAAHQRLLKPSEEATAQVTGWLDLLDAQRERFRLTLDTHERIWCQWPDRLFPALRFLWGRQVKVTGRGDFTLTGRLKSVIVERLDAVDPDDARAIDLAMKYTKQAAQSGSLAGSQP